MAFLHILQVEQRISEGAARGTFLHLSVHSRQLETT